MPHKSHEDVYRSFYTAQAKKYGHGEKWVRQQVERAMEFRKEREEEERKASSAADLVYKLVSSVVKSAGLHYDEVPRRNPLQSIDDATWAEVYTRLQANRRKRAALIVERIWKWDKDEVIETLVGTTKGRIDRFGYDKAEEMQRELYTLAPYHSILEDYIRVLRQIQADHDRLANALEKEMTHA